MAIKTRASFFYQGQTCTGVIGNDKHLFLKIEEDLAALKRAAESAGDVQPPFPWRPKCGGHDAPLQNHLFQKLDPASVVGTMLADKGEDISDAHYCIYCGYICRISEVKHG